MTFTLAQGGATSPVATPEEIRAATQAVLSQADYQAETGSSLLARILEYLLEQVGRVLLRFDGGGGTQSIIAALTLTAIVVALVVVVIWFLRRLRKATPLEHTVDGPVGRTSVAWSEEAERREAEGDLRQALRCRYRETLAQLASARLVEEIPGRTTGEYQRAVSAALPGASVPFGAMTDVFDDVWYGGGQVDRERLERIKSRQAEVAGHIPKRGRVPAGSHA